jgi:hypothetical protein
MKRKPKNALDWRDVEAARTWLERLESVALDVIAVAEDQTRPLTQRDIGRAEALRILAEAGPGLEESIAFARRGLPRRPLPTRLRAAPSRPSQTADAKAPPAGAAAWAAPGLGIG